MNQQVSYEDIAMYQWTRSMQAVQMADVEIARVIYWCKDPKREATPDLVSMIALYTEAADTLQRLEESHVPLEVQGLMSQEEIRNSLSRLKGFQLACEQYQPELFRNTLSNQLKEKAELLLSQIENLKDTEMDEEELEELLSLRDDLEHARMGVYVNQLEGNFVGVDYSRLAGDLAKIDKLLHPVLKPYKNRSRPIYTPNVFWWRN